MSNSILLTGATGFIGSHLTEFLIKKGYKVIAFDRYNSNNDFPNPINETTQNVLVFPNPFNEFIYLQEKCDIQVRDILGKIIYSDSVKQLKTSDWNSGIYFIHLLKQNQTIKVIKL